jgi:hypothetical protein
MNEKIKTVYQMVNDLWSELATGLGAPADLLEPVGKAANAMRDAAMIAGQPGLRQVHCVTQLGIIHAVDQRDGHPRCGASLTSSDSLDAAYRVPTCQTCMEIIVNDQAKV